MVFFMFEVRQRQGQQPRIILILMALLSLKSSSEDFLIFLEMILGEEPLPTMAKME